ncbi:uncharacterized protein LOC141874477 isoform X2 [Acropora palmata]|uniref:uncharacterized protein LOC141874477 isoform X2 n=1 Tax=Acropora palmata TaxID=6131 RepID=UPI003DA0F713
MPSFRRASFVFVVMALWNTRSGSFFPAVRDRVLARAQNSVYLPGEVTEEEGSSFLVTLYNGQQMKHSYKDITAVVEDTLPAWVTLGDHVIASRPSTNGSGEYLIGFVTRDLCEGDDELYEITFHNNQRGNCSLKDIRKLPFFSSTHQVGARVFARWNGTRYHRGFVAETVFVGQVLHLKIQLDDSISVSHAANDERAIVLDVIPRYTQVHATQRVIGHLPGTTGYVTGWVMKRNPNCWQDVYLVVFDNGGEREEDFNEIRILPPFVQLF